MQVNHRRDRVRSSFGVEASAKSFLWNLNAGRWSSATCYFFDKSEKVCGELFVGVNIIFTPSLLFYSDRPLGVNISFTPSLNFYSDRLLGVNLHFYAECLLRPITRSKFTPRRLDFGHCSHYGRKKNFPVKNLRKNTISVGVSEDIISIVQVC